MKYENIYELINMGEGYHIEFKKSVDKTFIEEVCALANGGGGTILIGVDDNGKVCGTQTNNTIRSQIQDTVSQMEPKIDVVLSIHDNVIAIDIPNGSEKPYGCSKGFFLRIGPNSQKLTRNEIINFFKSEGRIRFDELLNKKADFEDDFDEKAFYTFFQKASITPSLDITKLLYNLDCCDESRKLTNAGVLFFAKNIEFLVPHGVVTCVLYKGVEKVHILDKKDFRDNLLENIDNAIAFVMRHTNLEFKIEHVRREEIPEIPEPALREAIVNAVCHRDYFEKGANVVIEIYDDRVEITNPGGLPTSLPEDEFGTKSVVRNAIIAALLNRVDYIEQVGTGITRMRNLVAELGKGSIEFKFTNFFTVTFSRVYKGKMTGKETGKMTGKMAGKIIALIKDDSLITIPVIAEQLGISLSTVNRAIRQLKQQNILQREGGRKEGVWIIHS